MDSTTQDPQPTRETGQEPQVRQLDRDSDAAPAGIPYQRLRELADEAPKHTPRGHRPVINLEVAGTHHGRVELAPGLRGLAVKRRILPEAKTVVRVFADEVKRWLKAEERKGRK